MTPKRDQPDFKPWDREEGRKRKPERGDSIPPKTGMSARLHSKPKVAGQEYLDMYIMLKQKERTEKYGNTLFKRQEGVLEEWKEMKKTLFRMEETLPDVPRTDSDDSEGGKGKSKSHTPAKLPRYMKKMDWNY